MRGHYAQRLFQAPNSALFVAISAYSVPAIVCDAGTLSQIAIIQELGKLGVPVIALSNKSSAIGFTSRYARHKILAPMPSYDASYVDFLIASVPRGVVYYSNDANTEIIATHKNRLLREGFSLLVANREVLDRVVNKDRLFATGKECGIAVPRCSLVSLENLAHEAAAIGFPCIVKSTNLAGGIYEMVLEADAVHTVYGRMCKTVSATDLAHRAAQLMVQEWIPQEGVKLWNFNACVKGGEIISFAMGERIRSDLKPNGVLGSMLMYGLTAYNDNIIEANRRLLRHLRFDGFVETEWSQHTVKRDQLYLYDFNPRPSGNIRWTIKSGVPVVEDYYRLSLGLSATRHSPMREGVRYVKLVYRHNDPMSAWANPHLSLAGKTAILKEDLQTLFSAGNHAIDVFDSSDWRPTLAACHDLVTMLVRRRCDRVRSRVARATRAIRFGSRVTGSR